MISNTVVNLIGWYGIFAISTGITAYFTVYKPVYRKLKEDGIELWEHDNPITTSLVIIAISTLLAPLVIKSALFGASDAFLEAYLENILKDDD